MGLYWLTYGITYLPGALAPVQGYSPGIYIGIGMGQMIVGVILMFAADGFVETCYSLAALKGQEGIVQPTAPKQESED
jgi:hypothetical protein